jgi:hypothetical protein
MHLFTIQKCAQGSPHLGPKGNCKRITFNWTGSVVKEEADEFGFPREQDIDERNRSDLCSFFYEQLDEIKSPLGNRIFQLKLERLSNRS